MVELPEVRLEYELLQFAQAMEAKKLRKESEEPETHPTEPWKNYSVENLAHWLKIEIGEWMSARDKKVIHGPHGQLDELTDIANLAWYLWTKLKTQ